MKLIIKGVLVVGFLASGMYFAVKGYGYISFLCGIFSGGLFSQLYSHWRYKK